MPRHQPAARRAARRWRPAPPLIPRVVRAHRHAPRTATAPPLACTRTPRRRGLPLLALEPRTPRRRDLPLLALEPRTPHPLAPRMPRACPARARPRAPCGRHHCRAAHHCQRCSRAQSAHSARHHRRSHSDLALHPRAPRATPLDHATTCPRRPITQRRLAARAAAPRHEQAAGAPLTAPRDARRPAPTRHRFAPLLHSLISSIKGAPVCSLPPSQALRAAQLRRPTSSSLQFLLLCFFPKSRALSSISSARPSQLDCFDGEHPKTLLNLPQAASFPLHATSELPTSSELSRLWLPQPPKPTSISRAYSHRSRIPSPSSLSPCPRIQEWWPELPPARI